MASRLHTYRQSAVEHPRLHGVIILEDVFESRVNLEVAPGRW